MAKKPIRYRLGLDIGIGSVGWAVVADNNGHPRIENFGTRLFDSGETDGGKSRTSQERRGFRGVRRLVRRRRFRKDRLKAHLQNIGLISIEDINRFCWDMCAKTNRESSFRGEKPSVYQLKVRGLSEQLKPEELAACLIHACNHRGYRDFYAETDGLDLELVKQALAEKTALAEAKKASEGDKGASKRRTKKTKASDGDNTELDDVVVEDDDDDEEAKEQKKCLAGAKLFEERFCASGCKTVSEYILRDRINPFNGQPFFRNRKTHEDFMLIRREYVRDEVVRILEHQQQYYRRQLNNGNVETIVNIIFAQRCFEDGPGEVNDKYRRYSGFLDSLGNCPFYRSEKRGFRATVIGDCYAVANALSQYRYVDKRVANCGFGGIPVDLARELMTQLLENGKLSFTEVKRIAGTFNVVITRSSPRDDELPRTVRFLGIAKKCIESAGESWHDFVFGDDQFDLDNPSRLHRVAEFLSTCVTPRRRRELMAKHLPFLSAELIKAFSMVKLGGTSGASYRYMCDAVAAFREGDIYGSFQARKIKEREAQLQDTDKGRAVKLSMAAIADEDVKDNPVVFRSICEVRKVVNAVIDTYGSPEHISVEVASEVNRSFKERKRVTKLQDENRRQRDEAKKKIADIVGGDVSKVTGAQLERYTLYEKQDGKCLYSGEPIADTDLKEVILNKNHTYEVDHIVPYSLVLDNTLHNKALVLSRENQNKGQKTPLMYLKGERAAAFKARVNALYAGGGKNSRISEKKYGYLMLEDLWSSKGQEILSQWKSRNINDTRYITKYIVEVLRRSLVFNTDAATVVYAVKGGFTSQFRRIWLRGSDWGDDKKNRASTLNHALDAVVVACLTPENLEIAGDANKLTQIRRWCYNKEGQQIRPFPEDFYKVLVACKNKMRRYWHMSEERCEELLKDQTKVLAYIPDLRGEVEVRFRDVENDAEWVDVANHTMIPLAERKQLFIDGCIAYYHSLDDFIVKPHLPVTSRKPSRRFRGAIADSNPIRIRTVSRWEPLKVGALKREHLGKIRGVDVEQWSQEHEATLAGFFAGHEDEPDYTLKDYLKSRKLKKAETTTGVAFPDTIQVSVAYPMKIVRKPVVDLKADALEKLYLPDPDLRSTLERILRGPDSASSVAAYLKAHEMERFVTDGGRPVNKVSLISGPVSNFYRVSRANGCGYENYSNLGMLKYYCIEVYRNVQGKTTLRGVRYVDVVRRNKRLCVQRNSMPEDYAEHMCYLFANDYVQIVDKNGEERFCGYYLSVANINQNQVIALYANETLKGLKQAVKGMIGSAVPPRRLTARVSVSAGDRFYVGDVSVLGEVRMRSATSLPFSVVDD